MITRYNFNALKQITIYMIISEVNMVSKKSTRKLVYEGNNYYWYVRVDDLGHKVHIMSEDKKLHLVYPFVDTEVPITSQDIRKHLKEYYAKTDL